MSKQSVSDMINQDDDDGQSVSISRRKTIVGAGTLALLGGVGTAVMSSPAAAADLSADELIAEDAEITSHDGSITEILVTPTVVIEWEGFNQDDTPVDEISITFDADGETEPISLVDTDPGTLSGTNGSQEFSFDETDLLAEETDDNGNWSPETFEADVDGEEERTNVTVTCAAVIDEEDLDESTSETYQIIVNNHEAQLTVGGEVETNVESDEEVE